MDRSPPPPTFSLQTVPSSPWAQFRLGMHMVISGSSSQGITGTIHLGQSPCAQIHIMLREQGSSFAGGCMQRVHCRGSQVLSECCTKGYSATLARAHVHRFICSEEKGSSFAGERMQRVHRKGSKVLSACYMVGYSATLARAHVHRFILCSKNRENRGLPSLGDLCREFIAKDHRYYLNVIK